MTGAGAEAGSPFPIFEKDGAAVRTKATPPVRERWSARRTLCFIMVTCGGFWAAVLALILR